MKKWKRNSWKNYPVKHIPNYGNEKELNMVLRKIKNYLGLKLNPYWIYQKMLKKHF